MKSNWKSVSLLLIGVVVGVCFTERWDPFTKVGKCEWIRIGNSTAWRGTCGIGAWLETDTPSGNRMKFCPNCGKRLVVATPKLNSKDGDFS